MIHPLDYTSGTFQAILNQTAGGRSKILTFEIPLLFGSGGRTK
jgi:hypothetical protein